MSYIKTLKLNENGKLDVAYPGAFRIEGVPGSFAYCNCRGPWSELRHFAPGVNKLVASVCSGTFGKGGTGNANSMRQVASRINAYLEKLQLS